jgi:hypothetical protein
MIVIKQQELTELQGWDKKTPNVETAGVNQNFINKSTMNTQMYKKY